MYEKKKNGELLAEVIRPPCGPIVVMIDGEPSSDRGHMAVVHRRVRDIAPLTGNPDQQFIMKARSRMYVVTGAHLIDARGGPAGRDRVPEMVMEAKSVRHQAAARARWNGVGISGPT